MIKELYIPLWGGLFLLIFVDLAILVYVAFTKLEEVEKYLKNSSEVIVQRRIWGGGVVGRIMRLTRVGGLLMHPEFYQKHGLVDIKEVQSMPRGLRLWVVIPGFIILVLCIAMFSLWAWDEVFPHVFN
ncbi:hypothetical protein SAMN02745148_02176 [Modicisalibacter ilicicola DSM 19980]|uniref:Uncharacterized protein n=1 Tax=Modicisalibacter ilicicola DSM 19980 TaxID=1121942 RepID=A0A1M5A4X0_9GAMM|nr:hypothetical protein [Halomonas ilicicola]SHF25006.1 hypothetical protein SAMN02745148_02176 [Halomonas ilicicola DSM 19980]